MVIGLGGDSRGDDAAGLEVVRRLRGSLPPSVAIAESAGDPAQLVEAWTGARLAVVIDAVSSGAAPGTVHRRTGVEGGPCWHGSSHSFGLADAADLGRALGRMPAKLVVIGIEGGDFTIGAPITPPVLAAIDALVRELEERFRQELR
ncbi:hydrogenase maturation protease [Microbispora triticiradicis]|uniref:hydrogenase maturation protease n=1 Tax=Microbispora triticiradicis TaxID=2200763 RepID=UPI0027DE9EA0|nr:hydrogenase maturation protease [Microbispora triticiradicis]